jgi:hypothetical protein
MQKSISDIWVSDANKGKARAVDATEQGMEVQDDKGWKVM